MTSTRPRRSRRTVVEVITADSAPRPSARHWPTPRTPDDLFAWIERELGLRIAQHPLIDGHRTPADYLVHAFFEGALSRDCGASPWRTTPSESRTADCVVWANRGGGKTFLGALASLLDLLFKPGVQVRILAGSLEQSRRMHDYLLTMLARPNIADAARGGITTRSVRTERGSCAQVLAASQTSVRGTRVQKIRCDEVDLFDADLWTAAQLVTRSLSPGPGPWGPCIRGSVEALSTMHRPHGLMWDLVFGERPAPAPGIRAPVFRWGVLDVLEQCPAHRPCEPCGLWAECAGRAKHARTGGHITIDDALALKSRVDLATWQSEMLCLRPHRAGAVFPEFDPALHVLRDDDPRLAVRRVVEYHGAMDFGIRSESVVLLASLDEAGVLVVEREHVGADQPLADQVAVLRGWIASGACAGRSGPTSVAIDPAGLARSEQTGVRNAAVLRAAGWPVRAPRAGVQTGLRLVRRRLNPALGAARRGEERAAGAPAPTLYIHQRCARLIECLQRYHYPDDRPGSLEPVKDGFDHACDALRYLVASIDGGEGVRVAEY